MQFRKISIVFGVMIITLSSCSTLSLTPEQTIIEYSKINDKTIFEYYDFRLGLISALGRGNQFNNGLPYVYAYNKKNKKCRVEVNEKTTLRITKQNGKKVNMYFDTSFMKDSYLYGNRSHFLNLPEGPFKITELKKIEIQTTNNLVGVEN